jgi:dGTPase
MVDSTDNINPYLKKNSFYSAFDLTHRDPRKASDDIRSPFQIDRDRIVFSYAFRRLQSKTQVFQSGEFDFYRTRLTHSLEVAKIARSIVEWLNHSSDELTTDCFIDSDLVEAIGLAHDLGHPPFGHIGERKLNQLTAENGGFEGNAQTLRILTHLFYNRNDATRGMNPSRALLDGVLKYKTLHRHATVRMPDGTLSYPNNHFIYDEDEAWLDFTLDEKTHSILEFCSRNDSTLNAFKSIECQIMDWADDTAYSINDIIDGIQAGYLNTHQIETWASQNSLTPFQCNCLEDLLQVIRGSRYEAFLNKQIGEFIHAVTLHIRENPLSSLTNRYAYGISIRNDTLERAHLYKSIAVDLIFRSPQIQRIEYKGALLLEKLYEALVENYSNSSSQKNLHLLADRFHSKLLQTEPAKERTRIIADALSEMTDAMAIRTYKQLFDPEFGSILDIV